LLQQLNQTMTDSSIQIKRLGCRCIYSASYA
jgi:hypothetical protein